MKIKHKLPCNIQQVEQYLNKCLLSIVSKYCDEDLPYITVNSNIKVGDILSLTIDRQTYEVEIISDEENKLINN